MTDKKLVVATPQPKIKYCTCSKDANGKITYYNSSCPFHRDEAKFIRG